MCFQGGVKWKVVAEKSKSSKQWSFKAWWWWRRQRKRRRKKRCAFNLLSTLWATYCQFLLLPPVKYKSRCFPNISINYVHVPINLLIDCVRVVIFLNITNKLGSTVRTQHVYCKVSTAFLYTQIHFGFQKGQLNRKKYNFRTCFSKCS